MSAFETRCEGGIQAEARSLMCMCADIVAALTSPRALRDFVAGQLPSAPYGGCERSHELKILPRQSKSASQDGHLISCVCASCRYHFHIRSDADSSRSITSTHREEMHMFVPGDEIVDVDGDGIQKKTITLTCIVDDCDCNIEVSMLPPVITDEYVQKFNDAMRVKQNLRAARQEYPDRYNRPDEAYAQDVIPTFLQYLRDTMDPAPEKSPPAKIKTRNKMFIACFGEDFDGFLRSLNFEKLVLEDDDVWMFPKLESAEAVTPIGSLRAKWEDVEAELLLLARRFAELKAAWNDLQRIFSGTYKALNRNMLPHIPEEALQLLGCLEDYRPTVFSWAAMLLGDKCSQRRSDFLAAAQSCGLDRAKSASKTWI